MRENDKMKIKIIDLQSSLDPKNPANSNFKKANSGEINQLGEVLSHLNQEIEQLSLEKSQYEIQLADYKNKYWRQKSLMEDSIYIIQEIIKESQGNKSALMHAL